ncbi:hypothetical protein HPB51_025907 [Rhipicephalus microplus]|uniref:Uncharacterized protein n=1 Tax=Rhipicephalus microplus TaxID=6941 RepID=A0A9J6EDI2_RHIMP|nr:hypothetical protein HPB51_025907 [Rhipicephalus microplus]
MCVPAQATSYVRAAGLQILTHDTSVPPSAGCAEGNTSRLTRTVGKDSRSRMSCDEGTGKSLAPPIKVKPRPPPSPPTDGQDFQQSRSSGGRSSQCSRSHSRGRSRSRSRSRSRGGARRYKSGSRSRSRSSYTGRQQQPSGVSVSSKKSGSITWADTVRGGPAEVLSGSLPEHAKSAREISQLKRENTAIRETINRLMSEIAEIKNARNQRPQSAAACIADTMPLPIEVHSTEAGDSSSEGQKALKKRAIAYE